VICKKPYVVQGLAFGCGQCIPCLVNKRREWTHRIMLEAECHEFNSFLTLTYDDDHLPSDGSVDPRELTLFMKRLRFAYEPDRLRFYGVGEYGEQDGRPHYHVAVFGMRACERINTQVHRRFGSGGICCDVCTRVRDLWAQGFAFVGQLEPRSAAYVAGYVTKKIGGIGLNGGHPPFARMSNRPGIGCMFMDEVASTLLEVEFDGCDVPYRLRQCSIGKKLPLGKYLRRQLRKRIGRDEKAPEEAFAEYEKKMQLVRAAARARPKGVKYEDAIRGIVQDLGLGRRIQLEAKERRIDRRKVL